jgi:hypothetical protein
MELSGIPTAAELRTMMERVAKESAAVMSAGYELEQLGIPLR